MLFSFAQILWASWLKASLICFSDSPRKILLWFFFLIKYSLRQFPSAQCWCILNHQNLAQDFPWL